MALFLGDEHEEADENEADSALLLSVPSGVDDPDPDPLAPGVLVSAEDEMCATTASRSRASVAVAVNDEVEDRFRRGDGRVP